VVCATRCRLDRRAEVGGSVAASSTGLLSDCVLRFLRDDGTGVCTVAGGGATAAAAAGVELEDAARFAASRVDDRVTLAESEVLGCEGRSALDGVDGAVDVGDETEGRRTG